MQSVYQCLDLTTSRLYVSLHVQFCESSFPFAKHISTLITSSSGIEPKQVLGPIITPVESCISPLADPSQSAPPPEPQVKPAPLKLVLVPPTQNQHAMTNHVQK